MNGLQATDRELFFSRQDSQDPRLGDCVTPSLRAGGVAIIGYPDDEGIGLNGGRKGAALGPTEIRRWLYRMTPHARRSLKTLSDLGNLTLEKDLGARHEAGRKIVAELLQSDRQVLTLGGGNDYAYADGMALLDSCGDRKPLIINIDAHLDVRDTSRGLTSGTPFYRLIESGQDFDFIEFAIQPQCNSKAHWDYVQSKGGQVITIDDLYESGRSFHSAASEILAPWLLRPRETFLAIDMDAFAWPYAVGTSAAWPLGLQPSEFMPLLNTLLKRLNVRVLGLYETSPPLDTGGGTARLAAQIAHGFLHV